MCALKNYPHSYAMSKKIMTVERQKVSKTNRGEHPTGRQQFVKPTWPACAPVHPIIQLQQTIGNQAVQRVLRSRTIQPKLAISQPGDSYEQEADQVAEQVMRMPEPVIQRAYSACAAGGSACSKCETEKQSLVQHKTEKDLKSSPSVPDDLLRDLDPEQSLDSAARAFFEPRFGYDFGDVRVHADTAAEQSALDVNAHAYTVGHNIAFGAGRFAPGTHQGRRLIAHELTHVAQQSGADGVRTGQNNGKRGLSPISLPMLIQRQPEESPPKENPPKKQPPKKTLKSQGVDLSDPVAVSTATIIDEVLLRNQKLAPYIGDRLIAGFRIAEKGKFVRDSTDGNFDDAYRNAYELDSSRTVAKDTKGFFDPKKSEVHLRPDAKFGTALHESVHRLASPALYKLYLQEANKISANLTEVLKEGVTAFFTDLILTDEGLPNFNDAYRSKKKKVETLITALGSDGFDLIAKFNFKGTGVIEIGQKLGFTSKQFSASQGGGIREVLKRMEKAL